MELNIDIVLLFFLIYVYTFVEHSSFVKVGIACVSSYLVLRILKNPSFDTKDTRVDALTRVTSMFHQLHVDAKPHWVCIDSNIAEFVMDLEPVIRYDNQIVASVVVALTHFTKTYYNSIRKDDPLLYKNLSKHKNIIAKLVDIQEFIRDELTDIVYVMKFKTYKETLNIPQQITRIDTILSEKIDLVVRKYNFGSSVVKSV